MCETSISCQSEIEVYTSQYYTSVGGWHKFSMEHLSPLSLVYFTVICWLPLIYTGCSWCNLQDDISQSSSIIHISVWTYLETFTSNYDMTLAIYLSYVGLSDLLWDVHMLATVVTSAIDESDFSLDLTRVATFASIPFRVVSRNPR